MQTLTEPLVGTGGVGLPVVGELSGRSEVDSQKNMSSPREGNVDSLCSLLGCCITGNMHTFLEMPLLRFQGK